MAIEFRKTQSSATAKKVVLIGNCHAQYLGAVISAATGYDVRVAGDLFDGPIFYQNTKPEMISRKAMFEWLEADKDADILVMEQATPTSKYVLAEQLDKRGVRFRNVRFPYVKFDCLTLRSTTENPATASDVKKAVRMDRIHNELTFAQAGLDLASLDALELLIQSGPNFYTNNHFSGPVFASLFSNLRKSVCLEYFGEKTFKKIYTSLANDKGIAHIHSGLPLPEIANAFGFKWSVDWQIESVKEIAKNDPARLLKIVKSGGPREEYLAFIAYRHARYNFEKTLNPLFLQICLTLYSQQRFFGSWAIDIFRAFLKLGRQRDALFFILQHLNWDDARGSVSLKIETELKSLLVEKPELAELIGRFPTVTHKNLSASKSAISGSKKASAAN